MASLIDARMGDSGRKLTFGDTDSAKFGLSFKKLDVGTFAKKVFKNEMYGGLENIAGDAGGFLPRSSPQSGSKARETMADFRQQLRRVSIVWNAQRLRMPVPPVSFSLTGRWGAEQ